MTNAARFNPADDAVFDRIAGRYDVLCDVFSLGIHRLWKRRMATYIASQPWSRMLDTATGTGDVVLRVTRGMSPQNGRRIIASDLSENMLRRARQRLAGTDWIEYQILDAEVLTGIASGSVDLYSMSLGLKICDRQRVLAEAWRVLRPGGRLVVLEASRIPTPLIHRVYLGYMSLCMPFIGWVATRGDASAYRYLLKGVHDFPDARALAAELREHGFVDVEFERLSFGIVAIHRASKPS